MSIRETGFRVPLFVTVVGIGMALVGFAFAFGFFTDPHAVLGGADVTDPAIRRLAFSMGTRSFAMALALVVALALNSRSGLVAVLTMRAVTESLDLINTLGSPEARIVVPIVLVMIVAELIAIALLLSGPSPSGGGAFARR